jgi:hypothetical protein
MLDCVGCLHQTGSRLHEERRLAPPGSEGAPACAPSRVRPPGQPRRRKRRSRRCATCRRRLGRPCSDRRRPRRREKETEPHHDPAPLAVANRGRPPRAARRCPQASAPPQPRGAPPGRTEALAAGAWSRCRAAAGAEPGDGADFPRPSPPEKRSAMEWGLPCSSPRGACLLRRSDEVHERSREGK